MKKEALAMTTNINIHVNAAFISISLNVWLSYSVLFWWFYDNSLGKFVQSLYNYLAAQDPGEALKCGVSWWSIFCWFLCCPNIFCWRLALFDCVVHADRSAHRRRSIVDISTCMYQTCRGNIDDYAIAMTFPKQGISESHLTLLILQDRFLTK